MVAVVFYCMLTNGVDFVNSVVLFYCDLLCLCCFCGFFTYAVSLPGFGLVLVWFWLWFVLMWVLLICVSCLLLIVWLFDVFC